MNRIVAVTLAAISAVSAQAFQVSLEAETGLMLGQTEEIVYNYKNVYSRLDWEKNFVPVFAFRPRLDFSSGFFLRADFTSAVPGNSGEMEDYDWLVPGDPSICSNYSSHDLLLDGYVDLAFDGGFSFNADEFRFSPGAGVLLRWVKWTASNGYSWYNTNGGVGTGWYYEPEHETTYYTGPVVIYSQKWFSLFVTFDTAFFLSENLELECDLRAYIYPVVEAYDEHLLTSKEFNDNLNRGGLGGKAKLFASWTPKNLNITFRAGIDFEYVCIAKAYTSQRSTGKNTESQDANEWSDAGVVSSNAMQGSVFLGILMKNH